MISTQETTMRVVLVYSTVLVLLAGLNHNAWAGGNTAMSLKGVVVTNSKTAQQRPKRPTYVVPQQQAGNSAAMTVPETNQLNPQFRPTCWGEDCSDAGRLQNGG